MIQMKNILRIRWLVLVISVIALFGFLYKSASMRIISSDGDSEIDELKEKISLLEPDIPKTLYDDELMLERNITKFEQSTFPVKTVLNLGTEINFENVYSDIGWKRPAYHPNWHSDNPRWSYIPINLAFQQHHLFAYQGGLSQWHDLANMLALPEQDFGPSPLNEMAFTMDYPFVTRLITLEAKVKNIISYENQLLVVVEPGRTGLHIVDFEHKQLNTDKVLVQMVTPDGYELDYLIINT